MQIFKVENIDTIDLKIVDRTFSKLCTQSDNNTKILAIHVDVTDDDTKSQQSFKEKIQRSHIVRRFSRASNEDKAKLVKLLRGNSNYAVDLLDSSDSKSCDNESRQSEQNLVDDLIDLDSNALSTYFLKAPKTMTSANDMKQIKSQTYATNSFLNTINVKNFNF